MRVFVVDDHPIYRRGVVQSLIALDDVEAVSEAASVAEATGNPELAQAHNNYGIALASTGRLGDGLREFEIAVRLKPDEIPARYNLANAYLSTHRYREAIAQFEAVLRLDPGYAAARRNLELAKSRL